MTANHSVAAPLLALDAEHVAASLQIGKRTLQQWLAAGKFPAADLRVGRVHRWRPATVEAWLLAHQRAAES